MGVPGGGLSGPLSVFKRCQAADTAGGRYHRVPTTGDISPTANLSGDGEFLLSLLEIGFTFTAGNPMRSHAGP